MQQLTRTLLLYGSIFASYGSLFLSYIMLCRKAKRDSAGGSTNLAQKLKEIRKISCAMLFAVAIVWIVAIAHQLAHLDSPWDGACLSLIPQDKCEGAVRGWKDYSVWLANCLLAAIFAVVLTIYAETANMESSEKRSRPVTMLCCSHWLLFISWVLCSPLSDPLELLALVGPRHWTTVSLVLQFVAIVAYIVGITLWTIALIRVLYAWRRSRTTRRTDAQWPRGSDRDIQLQDV